MTNKRNINFFAIGLSFIFMFNPNINIIDFLPDFIGYIILCVSFVKLGDINESVSEAIVCFKRMIFVDAFKFFAIMWTFGISVTSEYNSSLMLWSFVFGVLEIVLLIPAYHKLFKGLAELGYFHENTSIIATVKHQKKNFTDKMRSFTTFFIVLKSILSFLPELSDLTSTEYYENQGMTNLYRYIGIMRFMAFVPVLVVGIIWLISIIRYFSRINKDTAFVGSVEGVYIKRVLPKQGIFVIRNVSTAFMILITGLVLSFDLRLEGINILPDFISAAILISFFFVVSSKTQINKKTGIIFSCIYLISGIISSVLEFLFFDEFYYGSIFRDAEALNSFIFMVIASIINVAVFFAVCLCILKALTEIIDQHTGYLAYSNSENAGMQNKIAETNKRELKREIVYCLIATALYAIGDICYILLAKNYGFMYLINTVCAIIFICVYIKAYNEIIGSVKSKYILE